MDDLQKELLKSQAARERSMNLIERLYDDIDRISREGPDGSEEDASIVRGLANTALAELAYYKIQIELEGTKYV